MKQSGWFLRTRFQIAEWQREKMYNYFLLIMRYMEFKQSRNGNFRSVYTQIEIYSDNSSWILMV
jgi:hypothetical protein